MKLTRFCSLEELRAYLRGDKLTNHTDHYRGGSGGSRSQGFCFSEDSPARAWKYLKGVVSPEACIVVDAPAHLMRESMGVYRDTEWAGSLRGTLKREWCTESYDIATFPALSTMRAPFPFSTPEEHEILMAWQQTKERLRREGVANI